MIQKKILEIAIDVFGQRGLAGASTREIAAAAGTAMSSITYHYGGEEGLYLAAADHIAEEMAASIGLAGNAEITEYDSDGARRAIHRILGSLLYKLLDGQSENWSLFIVREQMRPTEAFNRLFEGPMGQMLQRLTGLVCLAAKIDDGEVARITAMTLFGQVLVVRASNAALLRILQTDTIDGALADRICARINANTDAILNVLKAE